VRTTVIRISMSLLRRSAQSSDAHALPISIFDSR